MVSVLVLIGPIILISMMEKAKYEKHLPVGVFMQNVDLELPISYFISHDSVYGVELTTKTIPDHFSDPQTYFSNKFPMVTKTPTRRCFSLLIFT